MTSEGSFLQGKVGHLKLSEILRSQWEAFALWLFDGIPGVPGFALRTVIYKLLFKRLGGFVWVQPRVTFVQTDRLEIGAHFGANSGTYINAVGGIKIGNYVLIGSNVTISSGQHPIEGKYPPVFSRPCIPKPIIIEDDVWVGAGAVIMPGVTLRKGTVVGANAVVTRTTEEYSVVVGAPAKTIRHRN